MDDGIKAAWHALPPPAVHSPPPQEHADERFVRSDQSKALRDLNEASWSLGKKLIVGQLILVALWLPVSESARWFYWMTYGGLVALPLAWVAYRVLFLQRGRRGWVRNDALVEFDDGGTGRVSEGPALAHALLLRSREHREGAYRDDADSTRYRAVPLGPILREIKTGVKIAAAVTGLAVALTASAYAFNWIFADQLLVKVCELDGEIGPIDP